MSAVERGNLPHVGRVLSRIENGHNTTSVRHEAYTMLRDGLVPEESHLGGRIIEDLVSTWRHQGSVPDSQLDTQYEPPKPHNGHKKAA